ncbi:hypothetical protein [Candidatus Berkiella aquae]|uniref:Capsule polysaccharide biosynthesis protein n=1 Tax=Candidatus Berkiella aquae TaxID=295108 RepID=A0A0Q9YTN9_9GAMM|nr:hypothetical protein [Candidatus Berkiella aquae]MCS5712324.1 hypothetical protein [Candidatus Berkiella aquae]
MKQKVISLARKIKRKIFPPKPSLTEIRLQQLTRSCQDYIQENGIKPQLKILWPTLFNQDHTWWAHDGILISALRLRGAQIIPTMCDKLQADQCMIYAGVWQNTREPDFKKRRAEICQQCVKQDNRLWQIMGIEPLRLSSYLNAQERQALWEQASQITAGDWASACVNDFPMGNEVWKAVVNNNLQGEIKPDWQAEANQLATHHTFNVLALMHSYQKVLATLQPDRVVGNGGYYYQWGVVNHLCQQQGIPYYRYYPTGLQPMSWNYALNTTEIVHVTPAWSSWLKQPWTEDQERQVKQDLKARGLYVDLEQEPEIKQRVANVATALKIDSTKPTFLALTGVIWDANTNIKSDAFNNMYDWLFDTIEWFSHRPQYQLIIRVHPAENIVPTVGPELRSRFEKEVQERNIQIPQNVFIIKPEEKIETYDVMHLADVGGSYMSTTGLEFSCYGKPLIAIGPVHYADKGFTFEPKSKEDYFSLLENFLKEKQSAENRQHLQLLAMKYWYLYAFHASTVTGLFGTDQKDWLAIKRGIDVFSSHPKEMTAQDLLPGKNPYIDYFCDSVMNNLPIMGENRWPPKILEKYCKS